MNLLFLKSVVLMFLYVEQDMNLIWQSCSGLEIEKYRKNILLIREKVVLQSGWNGLIISSVTKKKNL